MGAGLLPSSIDLLTPSSNKTMNEPDRQSGKQPQAPKSQHAVFLSYSSNDEGIAGVSARRWKPMGSGAGSHLVMSKVNAPIPAR